MSSARSGAWVGALFAIFAAVGVLLPAATSRAQDPTAVDQARQLFRLGVQALHAGSPPQAADYFNQSYALVPTAAAMCNLGLAYERWPGHICEAQRAYGRCAAEDQEGRFQEHANERVRILGEQCRAGSPAPSPWAGSPTAVGAGPPPQQGYPQGYPQGYQVMQWTQPGTPVGPTARHSYGMTIGGAVVAVLGVGLVVGGAVTMGEANANAQQLPPPGPPEAPTPIAAGSPEEAAYNQARTLSDVGTGLYIGGAVLGALGATLIVLDLVQAAASSALAEAPPRPGDIQVAAAPTQGGAVASLRVTLE